MDQFLHFPALGAYTAGVLVLVTRAKQALRESKGKRQRPRSRVASKELRMADSSRLQGRHQPLLYLFMSYDVFKKHLVNFRFNDFVI